MTTVIEEVDVPDLTREHVERRLDDWARRIDDLYRTLESWLPEGWSVSQGDSVVQDEPMMREFGVPPRALPVLRLTSENRVFDLEPRALWIIGMNGRLDLVGDTAHCLVLDRAEIFEVPRWHLTPLEDRRASQPLDRQTFASVLQRA